MNYSDFIKQMQEEDEQERRRRERISRINSSRADREKEEEDSKGVVERIGDVLGGIGNFGKELLIDPITDSINTAGTGIGHIYDDLSGATQEREDAYNKSQDEYQAMLLEQIRKSKDQSLTQEERDRAKKSAESIGKSMSAEQKSFSEGLEKKIEEVDPMKQAGATVTLATTLMPAKIGSVSKLANMGRAAPAAAGTALQRAGQNVLSDATIAATASAADLARREGQDASIQDLAGAAGMGAAFGGALSGGGQLLSKNVRREAGEAIGRGRDAIQQQVADFASMSPSARQAGFIRIPGGREVADDVAPMVDELGNAVGAARQRQTQLDDALTDAAAPSNVNITDSGLSSRAAPGEVDPVTGLRNNAPEGGLGEGIVTKSRDQIMKDNKVQRTKWDRVNESLFDANAPLNDFAKEYTAKTGKTLAVEDNPHALAQLRNGMDEAGAARMQDLVGDMEFIRKNKLADAWKEYGIANQVVNDRAGVYSPEVVAAEARKLEDLQRRLTPEQFEQVQAAVQRTIDFQDGQLQRLRDSGFISQEGYDAIKEVNPNYFSRFNFAEYIDDNQRLFASTNSKNISQNIIRAVKGAGDDAKYIIEDPAEAITRATIKTENLIQNNKVFGAIDRLKETLPEMAIKVRDADDVAQRMNLSLDNQELRPIRNQLDRAIKRDNRTVRRLESQINQLEKKGLNLSLKGGGQRMTSDPLAIGGLGGDVPTSKAGQLVDTATNDSTDLVKQLDSALSKTSKAQDNLGGLTKVEREARERAFNKARGVSEGLKQDVIAEGAGTLAETNASKLGKSDTRSVLNNLIENGSQSDIDRIKKMVGTRDQKMVDLLDEVSDMKAQYDTIKGQITSNIDEVRDLADIKVPEGYEAISGWRNGIKEVIAVPQYIADAYKGKNDAQIGAMERIMSAASKPFKASATIFSPAFLVKNSIRDTGTHWLTSANIPKKDRLLILPYAKRWGQAFVDSLTNSEFAQQMASEGAGAAGIFNSASDVSRGTQQMVKTGVKNLTGETVKDAKGMFGKAAEIMGKYSGFNKYSEVMQKTGRALEYAPRLAEARAAIEKGLSDPAAALAARNALGDLQNGGTVSRLLNNYTPFFNSILQGNRRIVQAAVENPQNAMAMATAGIVLPAASGYLWNRTMYPDVLNQIPEYERENNFVIILGDEKDEEGRFTQVIKIPKNDAAKVIGNNIEVAMDKMAGQDSQGFAELFLKTIGYAQPIQLERDGELSGQAMLGSAPIASNPLVRTPFELATNTSLFTGRDIVPEHLQGLPVEDQITEKTPMLDAAGARVTGLAPQQVGAIRQGVSANLLSGKNPADQVKNVVSGTSGTRASNEFYQLRDEVGGIRKQASNAINKAIAANDIEAARRIEQRYNQIFQEKFSPWVETYGPTLSDDESTLRMRESFQSLKLNLSTRSIKQRRKSMSEKAQ